MAQNAVGTERTRIGLLLTGSYAWAGGLYYVLNMIRALDHLPDAQKPFLVIFVNSQTPKELLKEIRYPYCAIHDLDALSFFSKAFYKVFRMLSGRNIRTERAINPYKLKALYPMSEYFSNLHGLNCTVIHWIYDLQHKFLPGFFNEAEKEKRDATFKAIADHAKTIVVSSNDSAAHFKQFYPGSRSKLKVLRFVSIPSIEQLPSFDEIGVKYKTGADYFIVSNQFWQHKNHLLVLKALVLAKKEGHSFKVLFTGKQNDNSNANYFSGIQIFVNENDLASNVIFTGFISRTDQLSLMKYSRAVIQPSRFEGWSTVIEDAKMLNKQVLASSLPVHKEQLESTGLYFDADDAQALFQLMKNLPAEEKNTPDQTDRIKNFALNFMAIVSE